MSDPCEKCGYDCDAMSREIDQLKALCNELADAWDDPEAHPWSYIQRLQQRAREEIK